MRLLQFRRTNGHSVQAATRAKAGFSALLQPLDLARDYLIENTGKQFDPECVEAFLSRWDDVIAIATGQVTVAPQVAEGGGPTAQQQADAPATALPQLVCCGDVWYDCVTK